MKKYFWNFLISLDQLGNTLAGGDPDETISSRIGKVQAKNNGKIPRNKPLMRLIYWGVNNIDPGHFPDSIEKDEGDDAVIKE
jgi:hypothetical protein